VGVRRGGLVKLAHRGGQPLTDVLHHGLGLAVLGPGQFEFARIVGASILAAVVVHRPRAAERKGRASRVVIEALARAGSSARVGGQKTVVSEGGGARPVVGKH